MTLLSHHRRSSVLVGLLVAALLVVAGFAGGRGGEAEARAPETAAATSGNSLRVALDWFPNPDHVALYYGLSKGYFKDNGVDVTLKTPSDPSAGLKLVATNRFDLAVYYEGDMFYAGQQGLPVIAVGSLIPTTLNSMIAKAGSKVKGPKSVKGATIGSAGLPFDGAVIQTIRQQQGLSKDELKTVNVGFNLVPAVLTGKVDAVVGAYWNIEAYHVKSKTGKDPIVIQLSQFGVPKYDELVIVANKKRLASDKTYASNVRAFLKGLVKASTQAPRETSAAISIMKKESDYSSAELKAMVPATLKVLKPGKGIRTGCFNLRAWSTFGNWMLKNKLIKSRRSPATIVTNAYLPRC